MTTLAPSGKVHLPKIFHCRSFFVLTLLLHLPPKPSITAILIQFPYAITEKLLNAFIELYYKGLFSMSSDGIASVHSCSVAIKNLLDRARDVKVNPSIEPALNASDLAEGIEEIGKLSNGSFIANSQAHYAAIETACRNIFYDLLVRTFLFLPKTSRG